MLSPEIEAAKRASLGQVLFRAARLFNEQAIARIQARRPGLRAAHTQLLPHLGREGLRPSVLAERVGISKQAVGELLADFEREGLVERARDPSDRRAVLVRLTPVGEAAILEGLGVLGEMARELAERVGDERLERLRVDLLALTGVLEG